MVLGIIRQDSQNPSSEPVAEILDSISPCPGAGRNSGKPVVPPPCPPRFPGHPLIFHLRMAFPPKTDCFPTLPTPKSRGAGGPAFHAPKSRSLPLKPRKRRKVYGEEFTGRSDPIGPSPPLCLGPFSNGSLPPDHRFAINSCTVTGSPKGTGSRWRNFSLTTSLAFSRSVFRRRTAPSPFF